MKNDFFANDAFLLALDAFASAVSGGKLRRFFLASHSGVVDGGICFIPNQVALARRGGEKVHFRTACQTSPCCWYWEMPDGQRIYHFDHDSFERIRSMHRGICPECGNTHIVGGLRPHTPMT